MDKYSFLNAAHTAHFAKLYDDYLINPDSVEPSWRDFFQGFDFGIEKGAKNSEIEIPENVLKEFAVVRLIDGYRGSGHLFTRTSPVRERRKYRPTLAIENFDLSHEDIHSVFSAGEIIGIGPAKLSDIIIHLERIYCESIGIEYMYIRHPNRVNWIQKWINRNGNHPSFTNEQKKHILKKLNEAVTFESFLHKKYVGQKRFSLEGGESLIPALDALIEESAKDGVEEFVVGMAHRGRLNTLTNIFGKPAQDIFSEFDGKDYEEEVFDGDVKYHLGWTSKRTTDAGHQINMNIAPNPSHLEAVNAVVAGIARAKQEKNFNGNTKKVMPILIHGDAAIAGQGVIYEVVQMAQLDGYKTGGTIHIIVNNQIGFTTNYLDGRSSTYCTDVGKVTLSPVLHVNADDVESVVHSIQFALEYRNKFSRDVFVDLLGYRKYGHNEGDEPRFTQPKLYKAIAKHKNPRDIYSEKLLKQGVITKDDILKMESEYKESLEDDLLDAKKASNTIITPFMQDEWKGFSRAKTKKMIEEINTTFKISHLNKIAECITNLPSDKKFLRKTLRLVDERKQMYFKKNKLDWGLVELLAYGSLLFEGNDVRISGQDVERGTFSHRHAVVKVDDSEEELILLNSINSKQGKFKIFNSLLSEYGVMGFDYGYSLASPQSLTIWEAQFGDFSNGAQIMIDQYLSSAEDKWKMQNGLVLFLPHGYEGQGAEHSSARIERYLQLCAKDNMFVTNVTTPANLFHLLRRQLKSDYRKPLIVFTPKSLLRHSDVYATKEELSSGKFLPLIDDNFVNTKKVKSVVFCSGKFYYDLIQARQAKNRFDVAIIRIEQLFPLPKNEIKQVIQKYSNAELIWAQEEPRNMGVYSHLLLHLKTSREFRVASRRFYGSPAAGSITRFKRRHKEIIEYVFDISKNNMR